MNKLWRNDLSTLVLRLAIVYVVLFLCRAAFYLLNTDSLGGLEWGEIPALMRGALIFDTVSVIYSLGFFILLSLLPFRFRAKGWYQSILFWMFTIINSITIAINLADGVYFHYAKKRFTADEFYFTGNDNSLALLLKFSLERWYVVMFGAVLAWGMVWCYRRIRYNPTAIRNNMIYYSLNLAVLAGAAVLMIGGARGGFSRAVRPITLSNAAQYASSHQKASLILSNPFCVIRTIGGVRLEVPSYFTEEALDSIFTPYHFPQSEQFSLGKRNIVIFTLESFSSEHSALLNPDLYPDGKGYTPFLDSLMRHSYVFRNAYSNGRKSIDALPSILASIPSYKTPFILLPESLGEMRGLPRILAEEGYSTSFFCGSQHNSMGFAAFATLAGVDNFVMREEYEAAHGTGDFDGSWGIWDDKFLGFMARRLTTTPQPFFAAVFTLSSHHPFPVPERYNDLLPEGKTLVQKPVAYTDMSLRMFFDYARTQDWYANTIFVFTADHVSSEIYAEKTKNPTGNSSVFMFIHTPDHAVTGEDPRVAQQMDIMPTLLGLTGYKKPYFAFGRDVFNEPHRMPVATNCTNEAFQIITDSLVLFSTGDRVLSAYAKSDTLQTKDIYDPGSRAQAEISDYLKAILQQYYTHLREKSYIVK